MTLRLRTFLTGFFILLTAAILALGSAQAALPSASDGEDAVWLQAFDGETPHRGVVPNPPNPASWGYQLFEPVALEHQHDIQLASLGNFDYFAKVASECCNATNKTLTPNVRDEIIATPHGQRPDPSTYMSQAEIDAHLARFDDGAVRFTSRSAVDNYGTAGNSEAFVMPRSEFDRVVSEAGGDLRVVEQRLGLDTGSLSNGDTMAVHISRQDLPDLRVPSGNEGGANSQWMPGGFTSGGVPEAVVDLTNAPFTEIPF